MMKPILNRIAATAEIEITLTGAEWLAITTVLTGRCLTKQGQAHFETAGEKMATQLCDAVHQ